MSQQLMMSQQLAMSRKLAVPPQLAIRLISRVLYGSFLSVGVHEGPPPRRSQEGSGGARRRELGRALWLLLIEEKLMRDILLYSLAPKLMRNCHTALTLT